MADEEGLSGSLLLCDFAEALNGKLYVMGGGWTRLTLAVPPGQEPKADMSLGVTVEVPWNRTNESLRLKLRLVTEDGKPCLDADNKPVSVDGEFEVGRPPGIRRGIPQIIVLAVRVTDVILVAGGYTWILEVGTNELARSPFEVAIGGMPSED